MYAFYNRLGVHIYAGDREVTRAVTARLAPSAFTRDQRLARHELYRKVLAEHRRARYLCRGFRL